MDEKTSQITLDGIIGRISRLEEELIEVRQLLTNNLSCLERPMNLPAFLSPKPNVLQSERFKSGYWEVSSLGRFHHRCDGHDLAPCRSRRGQSILKYLLASPGYSTSVEMLIECFWPQTDSIAGAHNLQEAIYTLRRSLQGCGPGGSDETILFRNNHYFLNPALSIVQDVDYFHAACERGQRAVNTGKLVEAIQALEEARTLYNGDYLIDPYEEWASSYRLALQDIRLTVLNQLGALYIQEAKWELATSCYQDILAVDFYREDAYRQLMRCYTNSGRIADVKRTYSTCQECLRRDLNLAPTSQTTILYQQLIQQSILSNVH